MYMENDLYIKHKYKYSSVSLPYRSVTSFCQMNSGFDGLIFSVWDAATSVVLPALELTQMKPACGCLLQVSLYDADLHLFHFCSFLPSPESQSRQFKG